MSVGNIPTSSKFSRNKGMSVWGWCWSISQTHWNPGFHPILRPAPAIYTKRTSTPEEVLEVARAIASAAAHLHARGLMHGDLYAHNILINDEGHCYLGDFGAATFYEPHRKEFERIEVRAFGCLLEDLLSLCSIKEGAIYNALETLRQQCMLEETALRPFFSEMRF